MNNKAEGFVNINSVQMKSLLKSKTFWMAMIQSVIAAIVIFQTNYEVVGGVLVVKSGLDILLRLMTTEPVK
jgi:hypothetical protein